MTPKFKDAISNNLARLIAGGIIALLSMLFTWAITPVREIVSVPRKLEQIQKDFEHRQMNFISALDKQRQTDSVMYEQITTLKASSVETHIDLGVIKSKVNVICSEFPALHKRFSDIEEAVSNTSLAWTFPIKNNYNKNE